MSYGQDESNQSREEAAISHIKESYKTTNKDIKSYRKQVVKLLDESSGEGKLVGYYDGAELKLMVTSQEEGMVKMVTQFYLSAGKLYFAYTKETPMYSEEPDAEKIRANHFYFWSNGELVRWIGPDGRTVNTSKDPSKAYELVSRCKLLKGFLTQGMDSNYAKLTEIEKKEEAERIELERRAKQEQLEREKVEREEALRLQEQQNRRNRNPKTYLSDGTACKNCKLGMYFGGSCNTCGAVSSERMQEHVKTLPPCDMCKGTGLRLAPNLKTNIECEMCKGKGYRTY